VAPSTLRPLCSTSGGASPNHRAHGPRIREIQIQNPSRRLDPTFKHPGPQPLHQKSRPPTNIPAPNLLRILIRFRPRRWHRLENYASALETSYTQAVSNRATGSNSMPASTPQSPAAPPSPPSLPQQHAQHDPLTPVQAESPRVSGGGGGLPNYSPIHHVDVEASREAERLRAELEVTLHPWTLNPKLFESERLRTDLQGAPLNHQLTRNIDRAHLLPPSPKTQFLSHTADSKPHTTDTLSPEIPISGVEGSSGRGGEGEGARGDFCGERKGESD
jgi:hypothetical protein